MKRKIYLATESVARRKIFKISGLKFRVLAVKTKERRNRGKLTYAGLVKRNALEKALAAARKIKSGVVIAADTITVQDKKIFGKPASLKDARKMLKRLSARPQDVYTGLAVIDKDKGIKLTDCEKTRVYMDDMTGKEIRDYFSKVNPLNKTGSFDIQGKGAFFIRRIEGCFYNVVGLPLRKLYLILKKLDIKVFAFLPLILSCLLSAVFLYGCSSEYNIVTGEQELYYYSTDQEVTMGKAITKQVDKEYKPVDDPLIQKRVRDVGKKIAAVCDRKEIGYTFEVLDDDEVNAFSLPGGFVYVNKGLVDKVANDDELACVLAHEVGHIVARHSIKKLQALQGYSILRILVSVSSSGQAGAAADTAFTQLLLGYTREDELLADQLGSRYAKLAGYDPRAMITFLNKLQEVNRRMPLRPKSYFKTHPYVPDRIRIVKQELGEGMNFKDYINIEDQPHAK